MKVYNDSQTLAVPSIIKLSKGHNSSAVTNLTLCVVQPQPIHFHQWHCDRSDGIYSMDSVIRAGLQIRHSRLNTKALIFC
jgi:hypothetical protein